MVGGLSKINQLTFNKQFMSSYLDVKSGIYDPSKRFAFTNITSEVFNSAWGGQPIIVQSGQTVELPHHLAVKLTGELVDKIMIGNAKMDEERVNQPYYRSPQGTSLGVPAARKVWEDQILRELQVDEESPELQVMRAQIREEIMNDLKAEPAKAGSIPVPSGIAEFAEFGKIQEVEIKKPLRVKTIKLKD